MKHLITIALILITLPAISQPDYADPEPTPIDGGAIILLAAGAAYGVRKMRKRRIRTRIEED